MKKDAEVRKGADVRKNAELRKDDEVGRVLRPRRRMLR